MPSKRVWECMMVFKWNAYAIAHSCMHVERATATTRTTIHRHKPKMCAWKHCLVDQVNYVVYQYCIHKLKLKMSNFNCNQVFLTVMLIHMKSLWKIGLLQARLTQPPSQSVIDKIRKKNFPKKWWWRRSNIAFD